jgi:phosphatidylserine/phosphatidylglycerophosphate/cardiolipin synthase-like enzyme
MIRRRIRSAPGADNRRSAGHPIDDAFQRVAGAPLVPGNRLRLLRDARENYPAWLEAIESARRSIHLEMYIVHADGIGRRFRDLLVARARAGVRVRVLYDWFGSLRLLGRGFWAPLRAAGGEVRVANPPRLDSLLGWLSRDHRKLLVVDHAEAFVSGLCIGDAWIGDPDRGRAPWRDTGVGFAGPAVADAQAAFAAAWDRAGRALPRAELPHHEDIPAAGPIALRLIATEPETATLYRVDLLVAAAARHRLWLTDAYFLATPSYLQALCDAARDGVDVRLLVPHGSDVEWIANVSRTLYRTLLAAGVRVFEWNGPMVHAKTAVADGRWARVGSTNLNLASWIGNWELDVAVEDPEVAGELERMFEADMRGSTEIVLTRRRVRPLTPPPPDRGATAVGSSTRVLTDVARMGSVISSAVAGHRTLGRAEARSLVSFGVLLLALAVVAILLPRLVAYPLAAVLGWAAALLLWRAARLRWPRRHATRRGDGHGP